MIITRFHHMKTRVIAIGIKKDYFQVIDYLWEAKLC